MKTERPFKVGDLVDRYRQGKPIYRARVAGAHVPEWLLLNVTELLAEPSGFNATVRVGQLTYPPASECRLVSKPKRSALQAKISELEYELAAAINDHVDVAGQLKLAHKRYGQASATIAQERDVNARLREKLLEYARQLEKKSTPQVFHHPDPEPVDKPVVRTPLGSNLMYGPYGPEGTSGLTTWWNMTTARHAPWENWLRDYGWLTEVLTPEVA